MENETFSQEEVRVEQKSQLHQVTPLPKYLAMALFIVLPFVGLYIGYTYAPEKVMEVEKEVIREVEVEKIVTQEVIKQQVVDKLLDDEPAFTDTPGGGFGVLISERNNEIYFVTGDSVVRRDIVSGQEEIIYTESDPGLSLIEDAGINGSWGNLTFGGFEEYLLVARYDSLSTDVRGIPMPADRFVDVTLIDLRE